jgi:hypothetical protein
VQTTTRYQKSIRQASENGPDSRPLKDGANNKKLGGRVKARVLASTPYAGAKLMALTLVERATCPTSCLEWTTCFGDGMPFAHRFSADAALLSAVRRQLASLTAKGKRACVRLHVLGDFASVRYVKAWGVMLRQFPSLTAFGYSARGAGVATREDAEIWDAIAELNREFPDRILIRQSGTIGDGSSIWGAVVAEQWSDLPAGVVRCPEQLAEGLSCATCGLCMDRRIATIGFRGHGQEYGRRRAEG